MLVSVIIPCFGEGRFLDACIESVRSQTHSDLDIIVIDDCGQGDSLGQALRYAIKDNRIRLFQLAPNCGLGGCRNAALKVALADWVVFLDGDDLLTPGAIEAHVAKVAQLQASDDDLSNFAGVYGDWGHIVETGTIQTKIRPTRKGLGRVSWASCQGVNPFIVSAPLVRKAAILQVDGFAEHTTAGEDFIAWMKLLRSGGWFDYTGETVTLYRQKASSMLRNSAMELFAVMAEVQNVYFNDFKEGVPSEALSELPTSGLRLPSSAQQIGDVRNQPVYGAKKCHPETDNHVASRRETVRQELMNQLPAKAREVMELKSTEPGVWSFGPASTGNTAVAAEASTTLAVAESRAELIETLLFANSADLQIDVLVPEYLLASITDTDFTSLRSVRFLMLGHADVPFAKYRGLLLYRDWGPVFEAVRAGFGGSLPPHTALKSCGISALNWKPLGAAKRYRLPRSQKFVQGAADEITLFSRGVSLVGSPVVAAFAKPLSEITNEEVLVLAPHMPVSSPADEAILLVWIACITGCLANASIPYRLASIDSQVAKGLAQFGCVTVSYRNMFKYSKVVAPFCDEVFFLSAAGIPAFVYQLDDHLGGLEFLEQMGLRLCSNVQMLDEELTQFLNSDSMLPFYNLSPRHLTNLPFEHQAIVRALGADECR
tara:strand:- start:2829 stop:4802 length:1974 start_codon:yes stop_codon:yes gene_type:complete